VERAQLGASSSPSTHSTSAVRQSCTRRDFTAAPWERQRREGDEGTAKRLRRL
jgi:hypothetical protein